MMYFRWVYMLLFFLFQLNFNLKLGGGGRFLLGSEHIGQALSGGVLNQRESEKMSPLEVTCLLTWERILLLLVCPAASLLGIILWWVPKATSNLPVFKGCAEAIETQWRQVFIKDFSWTRVWRRVILQAFQGSKLSLSRQQKLPKPHLL